MTSAQLTIAWVVGALWTWPWLAVAVRRSPDWMGDTSWEEMRSFDWGFIVWIPLLSCVIAWPFILSSLTIAKIAKRVTA